MGCSGTVAGTKYGVAKKANVYAVKVLRSNGSGTVADVVKGVEWAANAHTEKAKKGKKGFKGSAANMSLGGGKSPALDRAVNGAVDAGIHFAVAAGNDNADSCNYSPAAAEQAITVGASALDDSRAYFSNYGKQRHLCPRSQHSFHLDRQQVCHQHHLWHFYGFPTYRWSFGLLFVSSTRFRL